MKLSFWQALKSRTIWTGLAGAALSTFLANNPFQTSISPKVGTIASIGIAVATAIFRVSPKQGEPTAPIDPPQHLY